MNIIQEAVSYTHLDVYKRQDVDRALRRAVAIEGAQRVDAGDSVNGQTRGLLEQAKRFFRAGAEIAVHRIGQIAKLAQAGLQVLHADAGIAAVQGHIGPVSYTHLDVYKRQVLLKGVRPETIIRTVAEEKCTIVWLLVPWAQDILDAIDRGEIDLRGCALGQWRLMHIGAQPVPQSLIRRWKRHFPNHQYDTNYGLSESIGPGCVHLGVENVDHVGAIGVPGYGWQVRIVDDRKEDVRQGEVGELAVKGPGVMTCYYKDEKATREVLRDGWLFTGDMAMQDADGFIYLVDRKKDVIITGGENLYPVQIEDFLRAHDAVKDVAVIGLPHPRLGEIAAAIIELKPGAKCTEKDIEEFCKQLPRYKRPRRIIFAEVPRNPTGKIEKPKLRKMYSAEHLVASQVEG